MSVPIQVRRGTKAALVAHGALQAGELGFCTDEKTVYVGDGTTNYLVGRVYYGTTNPSGNLVAGTLYVNTANQQVWFCDGTSWYEVGAASVTSLDAVPDGTTYAKVLAADIASGHVTQIYDGATPVTANQVDTHMNNAAIHRQINDSGTAATDLWSAQKIQSVITSSTVGIGEFQTSVKDSTILTPPGSPATGDRYLINGTGTGAWASNSNNIAQWSGSAWVFTAPIDGMAVYSDASGTLFLYNAGSTTWLAINNYPLASTAPGTVSSSSSGTVGAASNLSRGDHSHSLGSHGHTDSSDGGQILYSSLSGVPTTFAPAAHGASAHSGNIGTESQVTFSTSGHAHDGTGSAQVSYPNLSNIPASFTPSSHASTHKNGGTDEIASATSVANGIPKAGSTGTLDYSWLPTIDGGSF